MKTSILPILFICTICAFQQSTAQSIFQKLKDKVVDKSNQKVDQKTDAAASNIVNTPENAIKSDGTANNATGNANSNNNTNASQQTDIKVYNNYDFVPGDTVIFEDHFTDDQIGEFPSHWDLKYGQAVLNKIGDETAFLLTDGNYCKVEPLMKKPSYLSDNFTIEYDVYGNDASPQSFTFLISQITMATIVLILV